ncbi:oligosaccharide flippase family protein (plasmid) [Rhodobacteraceae bacterium S2214]|nr:oligosaccharide flippase family protein [Rhodobacteraceae bacterium S2214]
MKLFRGRIFKNLVALGAIRGTNIVVSLVTIPYLVKTVGLENYGLLAFSLALATFFGTVVQYGFSISATRRIAHEKGNLTELSKEFTLTTAVTWAFTLIIAACFAFTFTIFRNFSEIWNLHIGAFSLSLAVSLFPHWLFLGLGRSSVVAIMTLFIRLTYIGLLILFVKEPADYILVHYLNALSAMSALFVSYIYIALYTDVKLTVVKFRDMWHHVVSGFSFFLIQFAPLLYNNFTIFFVGLTASPVSVGIFSVASGIIEIIISFGRIGSNAALPVLTTKPEKHSIFATVLIGAGITISCLVLLYAPIIAQIVSDENHGDISLYLRVLAVGMPFSFAYLAYNTYGLAIFGHSRIAAKLTVTISLISLLIAIVSIPTLGSWGGVVTLIAARTMLGSYSAFVAKTLVRTN